MQDNDVLNARADWGHFSARQANEIGRAWDRRNVKLAWLRDTVLTIVGGLVAAVYWLMTFGLL